MSDSDEIGRDSQQFRRDQGPLTNRGAATKSILLAAARRTFETNGFGETRIADIVAEARVARGTFYTYFDTKEDIFTAVAQQVVAEMLGQLSVPPPAGAGMEERAHEAIRRFIGAYRDNALMLSQMEQVGTYSPQMRELKLATRNAFVQRTRRGFSRAVQDGHADPRLDVEYVSEVLGSMLEYTCYMWFTVGMDLDERRLIDALSNVWLGALTTQSVQDDSSSGRESMTSAPLISAIAPTPSRLNGW
jgi:AcrR family transcriptional regulator